jgi:hypothetical protein
MSKIIPLHIDFQDTFSVTQATITTSWMPGQAIKLDPTGQYAVLATGEDVLAIAMDNPTELSAPPSGSLLTGFMGSGAKFIIDHSDNVAAGSSARAYETDVLSASPDANLYISAAANWTTLGSGSQSVKGKLFQVPNVNNNYGLGIYLRF